MNEVKLSGGCRKPYGVITNMVIVDLVQKGRWLDVKYRR